MNSNLKFGTFQDKENRRRSSSNLKNNCEEEE